MESRPWEPQARRACHCALGVAWSFFAFWEIGFEGRTHMPSTEREQHEAGVAAWVSPALASREDSAWPMDVH